MYVVDASVAVLWFVPQEHAERATAVLASKVRLLAPRFFRLEVGSSLLRAVRRSELGSDAAARILDVLLPRSVTLTDEPADEIAAFDIAREHGGSLYDGVYVALARRLGATLVTGDARMHRTAAAAGSDSRLLAEWAFPP